MKQVLKVICILNLKGLKASNNKISLIAEQDH